MPIDVSDLELPGLAALPGYVDGHVPAGQLHTLLEEIDPATLATDYEVVDYVAACERVASAAAATKLAGVVELVRRPEYVGPDPQVALDRRAERGRVVRSGPGLELAARLGMAARTADRHIHLATRLATDLAPTFEALAAGRVDLAKVWVLERETATCGPQVAALVQERVLGRAPARAPGQLRTLIQTAVLAVDPAAARARCARSRADRFVRIRHDGDDMALLLARIPAETALAVDRHLALAAGDRLPGDERTTDQRHADALVDLLLGDRSGLQAQVQVTIPASVLAGLSDAPGQLVGLGPISAHLARLIAEDATWRRLVTDPTTGLVIDVGTHTYRPGVVLKRYLHARDQYCVGPSCSRPAHACDGDHTIDWPVGPTTPSNLGSLCRRQHRFKQHPAVKLEQPSPGEFVWTYPTGHRYRVAPDPPDDPDPLTELDAA